jgi:hypothetical protein
MMKDQIKFDYVATEDHVFLRVHTENDLVSSTTGAYEGAIKTFVNEEFNVSVKAKIGIFVLYL